jgi:hypothetical protein
LERTILSIRRRLQAHASPATRYSLFGVSAILAELKALNVRPLPCARTIDRVLERNGLTLPRVRLPTPATPGVPRPAGRASTNSTRSVWWGRSSRAAAFTTHLGRQGRGDGAVARCWPPPSHGRGPLVLGECWKDLGRPEQVSSTTPASCPAGGRPRRLSA